MARQELKAIIGADARQFNRTMKKVKQSAKNIAGGIARAGAIGAAGLAAATVKAVNYGDAIDKAAKRTGITAETFQKLSFSAELSGASAADVEKAIKRMSTNVLDANRGLKESADTFDDLGVSMDDLKGKTPDQQLTMMLKRLAGITDATKRAALAQKIFGKSGTALLPIISEGADGFDKLFGRLEAVGGVLSGENVAGAAALKDAFTEMMAAVKGIAFTAILENADLLQEAVDGITNKLITMKANGDLSTMADDFRSIVQLTGLLAKSTLQIIEGWRQFGKILSGPLMAALEKFEALAESIARSLSKTLGRGPTRQEFIETASGEDALQTKEAREIRLNSRRARQVREINDAGRMTPEQRISAATTAAETFVGSDAGLDIMGRLLDVMTATADNTGTLAGTVTTGVS